MLEHLSQVGKTRIGRNKFNLSHRILGNCDMGQLIPIQWEMCIPSDIHKISFDVVIRALPLTAPILQPITAKTYTFFCPLRLLDDDFEDAVTTGDKGEFTGENMLKFPKWYPSNTAVDSNGEPIGKQKFSLWDYFGLPTHSLGIMTTENQDMLPLKYFPDCYYKIFNEYFRDEWLQDVKEPSIQTSTTGIEMYHYKVLRKNYKKDYFTSALSDTQKGIATAMPVTFDTNAIDFTWLNGTNLQTGNLNGTLQAQNTLGTYYDQSKEYQGATGNSSNRGYITGGDQGTVGGSNAALRVNIPSTSIDGSNVLNGLTGTIDDTSIHTFDANDLRSFLQFQKFLERNARVGTRYQEMLRGRFDVTPQDYRLQRPEFIGSTSQPVIISEVLQTGNPTDTSQTPTATMRGHGLSASQSGSITYKCQEHGILMTLLCIVPKRSYTEGIQRQMTSSTLLDLVFPEFTHLGERAVFNWEIWTNENSLVNQQQIFGFRGIYDEYRSKEDRLVGSMKDPTDLGYWSLCENFATQPNLNEDFIQIKGQHLKSIFAVQDRPSWIYHIGLRHVAYRPLPVIAEPGLIDHF